MSRIKRYGNESNNYVIWFTLSNGKTYYIGEGFVFLSIKDNIEYEVFKATARKYTHLGAKRIHTMIWNKYFNNANEKENGGHVVKSSCYPLTSVEKHLKYYVKNKYFFNHTLWEEGIGFTTLIGFCQMGIALGVLGVWHKID